MTTVRINVNGEPASADIEPRTHLADFLREHVRATGTNLGCEHGVCGSCTVLVDGLPVRSCITLAVACDGRDVRSIEGFDDDPVMESLRAAFSREHALQCGFCTPGMLIAARDVVLRLRDGDEARIRRELEGNLCRCTGYRGIIRAVHSVLQEQAKLRGDAGTAPASAAASAAAPMPAFHQTPREAAATALSGSVRGSKADAATAPPQSKQGWTLFDEQFVIDRPPNEVWDALGNLPMIASCIPGAELTEHDEHQIKGRMTVRIGPINAAFSGAAAVTRDDATMSGSVRGGGTDESSKSRTKALASYQIAANPAGPGTNVSLQVEYNLQGPLAQFSRSNLVKEIGRRLIGEFASNLNKRLETGEAPKTTTLNAGTLLRAAVSVKLKGLITWIKQT